MHPKQVESAERKARKELENQHKRQVVMEAAECGVRFYHAIDGTTFAYRQQRRNVFDVSTALLHPKDQFSKREGNYIAAENMAEGRYISLFVDSRDRLPMALSALVDVSSDRILPNVEFY